MYKHKTRLSAQGKGSLRRSRSKILAGPQGQRRYIRIGGLEALHTWCNPLPNQKALWHTSMRMVDTLKRLYWDNPLATLKSFHRLRMTLVGFTRKPLRRGRTELEVLVPFWQYAIDLKVIRPHPDSKWRIGPRAICAWDGSVVRITRA